MNKCLLILFVSLTFSSDCIASAADDLMQLLAKYQGATSMEFMARIKMDEGEAQFKDLNTTDHIVIAGNSYYWKHDEMEILSNEQYYVMVDHSMRAVFYKKKKRTEQLPPNELISIDDMVDNLKNFTSVSVATDNSGNKVFTVAYAEKLLYSSSVFVFNDSGTLISLRHEARDKDLQNSTVYLDKLIVNSPESLTLLNEGQFLEIKNGKIALATKFKNYTLESIDYGGIY